MGEMKVFDALLFFIISVLIGTVSSILGEDARIFIPRMCRNMLSKSSKILNEKHAARYEEEWLSHHNEIKENFSQLLHACGIYFYGARRIGQVVGFCNFNCSYNQTYKRLIETIFVLIFLLTQFPLLITIVILLRKFEDGGILNTTKAIGLNGKQIKIIKFKTFTRVGRFLRRTGLEKMPQLLNVITGDLSLVGPPPRVITSQKIHISQLVEHADFIKVRPGIFQVQHPQTSTEQYSIENSAQWYQDNVSFFFDMRMIFRTVFSVLMCDDYVE